jgi:tetratricopeptide (TPR) repeat protein
VAFERALAIDPAHPQSHFSLGVLDETGGRLEQAVERYLAALQHDPAYVEARLRLAALFRRGGQIGRSLQEYDRVLATAPGSFDALLGSGISLAAVGRDREARSRLEAAHRLSPQQVDVTNALVRLLSSSRDDAVRDGRRALALAGAMTDEQRRMDGGEAMAMALAEAGQFDDAVAWQRNAIAMAERAGQTTLAGRMAQVLKFYEQRRPGRVPWRPGEWP